MDYSTIKLEIDNDIVTVRLNRPDVMNAMSTLMRAELAHAIQSAPEMGRVLVLTGEGKAFCSGQDLGDGVRAAEADLERTLRDEYFPLLKAFRNCMIPTIAAVNGAAAGAGANIALLADVVIAAESAYFMQAFSRIGLIPDAGGTWLLPRSIGTARSLGMMLFAERISAKQALDWGLIWEAVPDAQFEQAWKSRAEQLAAGPTEAYKRMKRLVGESFDNDFDAQVELEAKLQGQAGKTRDFKEGVLAFLEKRPPKFEGR